jgi:IS30 family transposase
MKSEPHYSQLDYQDRQTIAISLEQGLSIRAIGRVLNRSASTISREITRNSGGTGYSCRYAQQRRVRRRRYTMPVPKLVAGNPLFKTITELLRQRWSPQQIAAHLAKLHPSDAAQRASHETIYLRHLRPTPRRAAQRACCLPAHGTRQALATL